MSDFILADGSASINGEIGLLTEKEYSLPLSKKDTTKSLMTALYELLVYADTAKQTEKENADLRERAVEHEGESMIQKVFIGDCQATIKDLAENLKEAADLIDEAENQIYDIPKLERDMQDCAEKYRKLAEEFIK